VLLHDHPLALTLAIDIRDAKRRIERLAFIRRSRDVLDAARVRDFAVGVDHQVVHLGIDRPLEHVEEALPGLLKRRGPDVLARRLDIVGKHVIGVAAHDLLGVFRLDAVDEPLFKRLDFRGIASPGRYAKRAGMTEADARGGSASDRKLCTIKLSHISVQAMSPICSQQLGSCS
jgi:hypothetical protein